METKLIELDKTLEEKLIVLIDAIKEADALSADYSKLLTDFNSTMVIYSEIKAMFARAAQELKEREEGEKENGTNN